MRTATISFALILVALLPGPAGARDWNVLADGSGDAPTIQAAVDSAAADDVVQLADGLFQGPGNRDISFLGKRITVTSLNGAASTTIDCENLSRAFRFETAETEQTVLSNVTIRNGTSTGDGGAIYVIDCSPTITGCVIDSCSAVNGGGIHVEAHHRQHHPREHRGPGRRRHPDPGQRRRPDRGRQRDLGEHRIQRGRQVDAGDRRHRDQQHDRGERRYRGRLRRSPLEHLHHDRADDHRVQRRGRVRQLQQFESVARVLPRLESGVSDAFTCQSSNLVTVDPQFCGAPLPDRDFSLQSDSPANSVCGVLVGALDIGCGTSAIDPTNWGQVKAMYR